MSRGRSGGSGGSITNVELAKRAVTADLEAKRSELAAVESKLADVRAAIASLRG